MSISKERLETLRRKIIKAFANIPFPKGEIISHICDECNQVKKAFLNQDSQQIQSSILEENYDKLPLFSPEAFRYFLPVYLIYSLEHFEEIPNEVVKFTVYALTPNKEIKEKSSWWQARFKDFTVEQFNLIYEFLDIAKESEEFAFFISDIKRGKERLEEFVKPAIGK